VSLAPGDMCVIVEHPLYPPLTEYDRRSIGQHVVLVNACTCESCRRRIAREPEVRNLWVCSGMPRIFHSICERNLRRLPDPPPLEDDIPTLTDIVESA
jgi:hypothetical protein